MLRCYITRLLREYQLPPPTPAPRSKSFRSKRSLRGALLRLAKHKRRPCLNPRLPAHKTGALGGTRLRYTTELQERRRARKTQPVVKTDKPRAQPVLLLVGRSTINDTFCGKSGLITMGREEERKGIGWGGMEYASVALSADGKRLRLLDQRVLPQCVEYVEFEPDEVPRAIKLMVVRGAPAIGAAAAYAYALAADRAVRGDAGKFQGEMQRAYEELFASRPTAVNLAWALNRLAAVVRAALDDNVAPEKIAAKLMDEAHVIAHRDIKINQAIGAFGSALLPESCNVLHHCNTGALATVGWGTALGVIRSAHEVRKKSIHVYVDETRPRLQGARLTAWELMACQIPMTLICDNMAAMLMRQGKIDAVLVGADRIAANGDTANKIGTYSAAVVARAHNVPFYVCAPSSTVDLEVLTGEQIPIEERDADEIVRPSGESSVAPEGVRVFNPAFDMTPASFITAIVTENGVIYPPFEDGLRESVRKGHEWLS
ncbi:Methylthioribose-1-phosphate isomerase 1 [Porphyridium purpureum]|uniref:Methylthioribose-1-phosphate isomerase n=1 Tax=Porphyridium purpureum TaxID=35688 RepID=A0A5J4YRC7_PORPP|nr:Methylthioribose-1-phosphate isomerase 1 [Porphyridium purpureum]|eukprot:POR5953..scf222_8